MAFDIPIAVEIRAVTRRIAWHRLEAEIAPMLLGAPVDDLWLPPARDLEADGRGWLKGTLTLRIDACSPADARSFVRGHVLQLANARPGFRATLAPAARDRHASRVRPATRAALRVGGDSVARW